VDHALDVAVGVEVEVGPVDLEPHVGVVLDALQRVHRVGGLVEERARPVHVRVLGVLPCPGRRVGVHGAGMAVLLHLVAVLEDVLHDPEPLALLHLQNLELAAVAHVDERQLVSADVDRSRHLVGDRHASTVMPEAVGIRTWKRVPGPSSSKAMEPPWRTTISRAIANPRPVPPVSRLREPSALAKRSKTRVRSSEDTPGPSSLTVIVAEFPSVPTSTAMRDCAYRPAFSTRLRTTRASWSASPRTSTGRTPLTSMGTSM